MDCKDIDKLLTAYLEGVASHEEEEQVQAHLAECSRCREELEICRTARERLGLALRLTASRVTPPTGSWEGIAEQAGIKGGKEKPIAEKSRISWLAVPLSIFLLVVLAGSFLPMMGGMATPPPPAPVVVSDEDGGAFLVWRDTPYSYPHNYSDGIYGQHVDAQGNCLWGDNKLLGSEGGTPMAVSDGDGGIIVAWGDGRDGDYRHIERLDSQGNTIWAYEEELSAWGVLGAVSDDAGGAILLWQAREHEVYAQRVSAEWKNLWGDEGVLIGDIKAAYRGLPMICDGYGGAVIIWEDGDTGISAQRINSEGRLLWGENGISVSGSVMIESPQLISDGIGNFFIVWTDVVFGDSPDVINIQKLDKDGKAAWGNNVVYHLGTDPKLTADGSGGYVIVWKGNGQTSNSGLFVQRVSSAGEPLWGNEGVPLWNIPEDSRRPDIGDIYITGDNAGNSIVIWEAGKEASDFKAGTQIYAQKLDAEEKMLWQDTAVEIAEKPPFRAVGYGSVIGDDSGGFIIASRVSEDFYVSNSDAVYAQRIDSDGSRRWGEDGLLIQAKPSSPALLITAGIVILAAIWVLLGILRGGRLARIFATMLPVLIGITALFGYFLLTGMLGYSYTWAYILRTPLNLSAAAAIPVAGLAIGVVGTWKRTAPKWVAIPIVVFSALITVLIEFIIFTAYI